MSLSPTSSVGSSSSSSWRKLKQLHFPLNHEPNKPPIGLKWRSNTAFIVTTVGVGMFTDMFLYGLIVPVLPFMLEDRVHTSPAQIQSIVSAMLAAYAAAAMVASPFAGVLADKMSSSRQLPFLCGLATLALATVLLAVGQTIPVLAIARCLQGASSGIVWTVGLALLVETVGPKKLGQSIGTIFSAVSAAALLSPPLGGILYAKTGYAGVFGVGIAILIVDFIMRLLVVEKKVAERYYSTPSSPFTTPEDDEDSDSSPTETSPLLGSPTEQQDEDFDPSYILPIPSNPLTRAFPILFCLQSPALLTAFFIGLVQAILLGAFDATVPLVASTRYDFDSLNAGLLIFALAAPELVLGPIFGWAVDRYGTKPTAVLGFAYLVPLLTLLRLPSDLDGQTGIGMNGQIALYASLLALNGVGLALINSPSVVEAGTVIEKYWKANPHAFGESGPYAQLYGMNSMIWSGGLTLGPLMAGALKERVGYGDMNAVLAAICAVAAGLSLVYIGGSLKDVFRRRKDLARANGEV
ncbi:MFS general substrate transporter [Lophium mytilinum]|uniref:MFS general substrate transporter n=1 Tax=Lophium mytilinum TaxID=390894 RepID=A0A6A6QXB9_9PEZI|nr:MFS general substrate transporter [Lophium mytilinum]